MFYCIFQRLFYNKNTNWTWCTLWFPNLSDIYYHRIINWKKGIFKVFTFLECRILIEYIRIYNCIFTNYKIILSLCRDWSHCHNWEYDEPLPIIQLNIKWNVWKDNLMSTIWCPVLSFFSDDFLPVEGGSLDWVFPMGKIKCYVKTPCKCISVWKENDYLKR